MIDGQLDLATVKQNVAKLAMSQPAFAVSIDRRFIKRLGVAVSLALMPTLDREANQ
jgi:hypothetical protein